LPGVGSRKIVLHLDGISDEQYAHIANAVWMLARATGCDFSVEADGNADSNTGKRPRDT